MATLEIAGKRVEVGDEFLRMLPEEQDEVVANIARDIGVGSDSAGDGASSRKRRDGGITADNLVRAAARGIPIAGGAMDQFAALMDAATYPVLGRGSDAGTFSERRAKNLETERARDKAFDEESPIVSTGAKLAGGVSPFLAAARVPALATGLGMRGPLRQQMLLGGASGGAIAAADAAVRGDDIGDAAEFGSLVGAGAPLAGRVIGKGYQAVRDRMAPRPPPIPRTLPAAGVDVPVPASVAETDPAVRAAAAHREEMARKGAMGEAAQRVALEADEATEAAIAAARGGISERLDPTGARPSTTAQEAGERIVQDAMDIAARRAAAAQAAEAAAAAEAQALRTGIGGAPASAVEGAGAVSRAVPAARQAAVDARGARYQAAEEIPIEVDPEIRNVGEALRQRLAGMDDPAERLWIDPNTTSRANEAFRILSDAEGGIFFNRAAPRAAAADDEILRKAADDFKVHGVGTSNIRDRIEAIRQNFGEDQARAYQAEYDRLVNEAVAARTGKPPADDTVAELMKLDPTGSTARRYQQQQAAASGGGPMARHDVAVPGGASVSVVPKVVEADSVLTSADSGYDKLLQPRNRDRAASQAQVNDIARNLDPKRLGVSSEADRGAPIIGPDGMVESGNGRIQALRKAYQEESEAAERYRAWLADQGVDVSKFRHPVLVRERATPMNAKERRDFTVAANQASTMSMSATEKALADANLIDAGALAAIRNPADLGAVENRAFIRQFFSRLPQTEQGALMTAKGDLSAEGLARVRNAVLAKAYGDSPILGRVAESTSDEIRSISNALQAAAPEWAALRQAIADGTVPAELDITKALIDAVSRTARLRARGGSLESAMAQTDAFGAQSDESQRLMRMFYGADGKGAAPASQIAAGLRHYAQEAAKVDASPGLGLGLPPVTASDVLEGAAKRAGAPSALDKAVADAATAERPPPATPAAPVEPPKPIDASTLEAARKRLSALYGDARRAAIGSNDWADVRAVGKIRDEFDAVVREMGAAGKISGDWESYLQAIEAARESHATYRNVFTRRGPGDSVGSAIEKIVGRYADTPASADEVARMVYGSASAPGGGNAARNISRLRQILPENDFRQVQQGLFSYLVELPEGGLRPAADIAKRIDKFLRDDAATAAFTAPQRAQLQRYADAQRGIATRPEPDRLDKVIAQIAGVDTGIPMDGADVANLVMKQVGKSHKLYSGQLIDRLKRDLTPEGWTMLRQGVWTQLMESPKTDEFGPQALASRLKQFLDDPVAKRLYSPEEIRQMRELKSLYELMKPPKGSAPNTSNSATTAARLIQKGQNNMLALIGLGTGGLPGAMVGAAIEHGGRSLIERRAAREAVELFHGKQPPRARSPIPDVPGAAAVIRGSGMEFARD